MQFLLFGYKRKQEHHTFPNILERSFKLGMKDVPTVVCDITEFRLANGLKVYFCAALDISTRRVLGYSLDTHQDAQLVKDTIQQDKHAYGSQKRILFHSDQGSQFASYKVTDFCNQQSMSRKGNCWDNAPQESFYGHFKDEAHIKTYTSFTQQKKDIKDYMKYYNQHKYQWNLKKMTPVEWSYPCQVDSNKLGVFSLRSLSSKFNRTKVV
ncbi:TPA: IS3 family transposase [Bacillus cereus]|nr:IS3 family transposase [Bacillus cereus]